VSTSTTTQEQITAKPDIVFHEATKQ